MKAFLATVLSVIAMGVLLIAYGLLAPRASAAQQQFVFDPQTGVYQPARPMFANERIALPDGPAYGYQGMPAQYSAPAGYRPAVYTTPGEYPVAQAPAVRTTRAAAAPQRTSATRVVERAPGRDWKKTALVIGGSTATAAGVGAIFGGKKGALIGAAIGGGASTIYETRH
jgi:hypothetical protein